MEVDTLKNQTELRRLETTTVRNSIILTCSPLTSGYFDETRFGVCSLVLIGMELLAEPLVCSSDIFIRG